MVVLKLFKMFKFDTPYYHFLKKVIKIRAKTKYQRYTGDLQFRHTPAKNTTITSAYSCFKIDK